MKKLHFTFCGLLLLACQNLLFAQSQTFISEMWTGSGGETAMFYRNSTKTDGSGNVYVAGSTINTDGNYDILVQKFSNKGALIWATSFDGAAEMDDVASDMFVDNSGNVFVTGVSVQYQANSYDLIVVKFNSSGTYQWSYYYNNGASPLPHDAGTAIIGDNSGSIFVAGASLGTSTQSDWVVAKISASNGSQAWASRYDYSGYNDAPKNITISGSDIIVTGVRQTSVSPISYELASVTFIQSNGLAFSAWGSTGSSPNGISEVEDMTVDGSGNIYIAGSVLNTGRGYDFRIIKLNSALQVIWETDFNGPDSLDDKARGIKVDNSGNVYVTGYSTSGVNGKNYATIKLASNSSFQWAKYYNGKSGGDDMAAQLVITSGKIFVTGSTQNGTYTDYETVGYDTDGQFLCSAVYDGPAGLDDIPSGITFDLDGNLIVTGQSRTISGKFANQTVKYELYEHPTIAFEDSLNNPIFPANEIIIRFDPSLVNTAVVDNKSRTFGALGDVIDSTFVVAMSAKTGITFSRQKAIKIYTSMKTTDVVCTSRLGKTVDVPPFWAAFRVTLPDGANIGAILDSLNTRDTINGLFPQIRYAEPNWYLTLNSTVPDDTHYDDDQLACHYNSSFPQFQNGHINAESAWAESVYGVPGIKVGVFDTGIRLDHEDFRRDINQPSALGSLTNTKIIHGKQYDYPGGPQPVTLDNFAPASGHGTSVAGIVAAVRNNGTGVAGVAGGDFADDGGNYGVSLYDMNCSSIIPELSPASTIINALYEGANGNEFLPEGKLDIVNLSWGLRPATLNYNAYNIRELKKAVRFVFENEIPLVAGRGNENNSAPSYPSTYYPDWQTGDDWVVSVGASQGNGNRASFSCYGKQLDVMAPGTDDIVYSTDFSAYNAYSSFNGTSASTPYVSGVVALLMAYHPTPLAPEDVEHLIEYSAVDKTPSGYDTETGWGLLHAGNALQLIQQPDYRVMHFEAQPDPNSLVWEANNYQIDNMIGDYDIFPQGAQTLGVFKFTSTVMHNLGPNAQIVSSPGKPGYWVRNSGSNLWGPIVTDGNGDKLLLPEPNVQFVGTPSVTSATLSGYFYEIQYVPTWTYVPYGADLSPVMAYSLLVYDPDHLWGIEENGKEFNCTVFPNPANESVSVRYRISDNTDINIAIYDIQGRKMKSVNLGNKQPGDYVFQMDISELSSAIYFMEIKAGKNTETKKIIKQ